MVILDFLCRDSLDLAFKYFTSSTLTVRLAGLSQITVSFFTSSAVNKLNFAVGFLYNRVPQIAPVMVTILPYRGT